MSITDELSKRIDFLEHMHEEDVQRMTQLATEYNELKVIVNDNTQSTQDLVDQLSGLASVVKWIDGLTVAIGHLWRVFKPPVMFAWKLINTVRKIAVWLAAFAVALVTLDSDSVHKLLDSIKTFL